LNEAFDRIVEVGSIDLSAESASFAITGRKTSGEQAPERFPHHIAFIRRSLDNHCDEVEGFLIQVNRLAGVAVNLKALRASQRVTLPHIGEAVRTIEFRTQSRPLSNRAGLGSIYL
jgi:hypothetical protein